ARADEQLGVGRVTNIGAAQAPSPPVRDTSKIMKPAAAAAAAGLGFGLGLAFLLELVLNHAVRRPGEIESKLHLPLFLTIPDFSPPRPLPVPAFLRRLPLLKKLLPSTLNPQPSASFQLSSLDCLFRRSPRPPYDLVRRSHPDP